jgi:hypothetical protein
MLGRSGLLQRLKFAPAFSSLVVVAVVAGCGGSSTSKPPTPTPVPQVVVATFFTNLHPVAGHQESVQVQFFRVFHGKNQRLSGAHLSVAITYGKKTLHAKGGITNKLGLAKASFIVPHVPKGTLLKATTAVLYKGKQYQGSNQVKTAA